MTTLYDIFVVFMTLTCLSLSKMSELGVSSPLKQYFTYLLLLLSTEAAFASPLPKVTVGLDHAPPYSVATKDGKFSGVVVDIMRDMQKSLPFRVDFVACPFPRCVKMLQQNEIDVKGGLIRTAEREKTMHFLTPPYMVLTSSFVFYARVSSVFTVNKYQDLRGKRIAVTRGAVHFPRFDQDKRLIKVEALSENNAFEMLLKGRVELVIGVEDTADNASVFLHRPTKQIIKMPYRFDDVIYGHLALSKQFANTELARQFQEHLNTIVESGRLSELVKVYNLPAVTKLNVNN